MRHSVHGSIPHHERKNKIRRVGHRADQKPAATAYAPEGRLSRELRWQAGLEPGDLILKVNGKAVEGVSDFYRKVWALGDAGVKVKLSILKGTEIRELTLQTADRYKYLQMKPRRTI